MADERTLAFVRELERADSEAAATLADLDELAAAVEEIRLGGLDIEARLTRLPAERSAAEAARSSSEREAEERARTHEEAATALAEAERGRDRERVAAARRAEVRARDAARTAARRAEAARAKDERLRAEGAALEATARELERRARETAARVRERPGLGEAAGAEPAPGLEGLARWATDARAALFVARGQLAGRRDALIRQANELGSVVLGESLTASSASAVARRLEEADRGD